ncbi:PQQ-dependent sugar dehydrogenase [Hathewaya massiliensis]|uniref:PQQ-dependent sugar dehydrogenase n=1 Tax=Hathewaya massiliensis TaxID=1964382 RepID=UPI00115978F7|nr:PQQ-dependent sugar dehydrogenase [Hathewaya massiliensis]
MKNRSKIYLLLASLVIVIIGITGFLKLNFYSMDLKVEDDNLKAEEKFKGFEGAVDFTYDGKDTYFVAFKNKIQEFNEKGWSNTVLKNKDLNISSIEYNEGNLYFASNNKVYSYNLKNKRQEVILKEIPNYGDYKDSMLKIKGEYLFVTIGSATNSGVVGKDNKWVEDYPHNHDITPKSITIRGENFGEEKTGAFVPYKTQNIKGQILTRGFPGNSSVIIYNLKTGGKETFAWGIRNIKGIDFSSEDKIFATVGGMENRGHRPVVGDVDYIFQIKKGLWYGWPDYSGGDPVTSPRFKGEKNTGISFLLDKHPSTNPPAPFVQHKKLNDLGVLAIDREEVLGEKDSIFFYEKKDNSICEVKKDKVISKKITLPQSSEVSSMKFCNGNLIILDSKNGIIYYVYKDKVIS